MPVLTVEPLGGNWVGGTMPANFGGRITAGNHVVEVRYPAAPTKGSIRDGVEALQAAIMSTPGDLLVFAHSQGAQVCSRWLRTHALSANPDRVSFLLIGNPLRKYGGYGVGRPEFDGLIGEATPTDTPYLVTDVAMQYDGWADCPTGKGLWANLNALADRYGINFGRGIHTFGYRTADLHDPRRETYVEGRTIFALLPHKPLLPIPASWIEPAYQRPERPAA